MYRENIFTPVPPVAGILNLIKMKKIFLPVLAFASLFILIQCDSTSPEKLCNNTEMRGKIISALMSNNAYMNEVMDSMRTKHSEAILSTVFLIAKSDKQMQENMADKMTNMCKEDASMCNMMMGKTMDMCEADKSSCNMMMGSMKTHPKVMKSAQEMCNMKGMNHKTKK